MAYTPREIKDRVAVGDDIFIVEDLGDNRVRLIPAPTHVLEVGTPVNKALLQPIEDYLATGVVPVERTITAENGLTGGGSLTTNRTLSVNFGTTDDRYYTKSQLDPLIRTLLLDRWTRRWIGTTNDLGGVAYADDLWVAVGNSGTISTTRIIIP